MLKFALVSVSEDLTEKDENPRVSPLILPLPFIAASQSETATTAQGVVASQATPLLESG